MFMNGELEWISTIYVFQSLTNDSLVRVYFEFTDTVNFG